MIVLKQCPDYDGFGVYVCGDMRIGELGRKADNKWIFYSDIAKVPEGALSEVEVVLDTLNK